MATSITPKENVTAERRLSRLAATDLNLLVPLLILLEERSVTRAAGRIGLSQPAVSHLLRRARAALGDPLLVREGSAFVLTPRARSLIVPLTELLDQLGDVYAAPSFDPRTERRVITVSATSSTSYVVIPSLLARLREYSPDITLRVHTYVVGAHDDFFAEFGADVAILPDVLQTDLPRERLYTDSWVVVADASNEELRHGLTLEHFGTLPHVVFSGVPLRTSAYAELEARNIKWTERTRVSDFLLIPHLLIDSNAIAIVHKRVAAALAKSVSLSVFEPPFPLKEFGMDLVWNPHLGRDPMKNWLREQLLASVEGS